jgi:hypothetical protein
MVKHNPNNIGTAGGNTPGTTTITQPQQQQPTVPNNNAISPPSVSPPPQIGSPTELSSTNFIISLQ